MREDVGGRVHARPASGEVGDAADGDETECHTPPHSGSIKFDLPPDERDAQAQQNDG